MAPELRFGAAGLGRRRISRPPDASVSRGGGVWERLRCGCRWHCECRGWCAAMRTAAWLRAARAVPRCSAAQRLRALGWFADAGWQDLRAVHDSRGPCSEKGPFLARSSRGVSSDGDLRGFSDTWRAHLAKASPFSDAWRADLARNWRFSRPRPLSGCMERKTCHGLPPGNAPRRNLATARPPRTHCASILPLPVRPRAHQGAVLPPSDARERIASIPCHWQTSENAQRRHTATASRPSRSALHAREWVQALGCAVGFGAQYFLCEGVGIPSPRGLTAGNDFESALFRWATMSSLRVLRSCAVLCAEAKSALTFI